MLQRKSRGFKKYDADTNPASMLVPTFAEKCQCHPILVKRAKQNSENFLFLKGEIYVKSPLQFTILLNHHIKI